MSFVDSLKTAIGIEELDDDEMITEEEISSAKESIAKESRRSFMNDTVPPVKASSHTALKPAEKRYSVTGTSAFKLVLIEPKSFEECPKLVDSLKGRRPVIINLEKLETEVARKIFDFMNGATYAINGSVQKVANNIFIFAPDNVGISAVQEEKNSSDFASEEKNLWRR